MRIVIEIQFEPYQQDILGELEQIHGFMFIKAILEQAQAVAESETRKHLNASLETAARISGIANDDRWFDRFQQLTAKYTK